MKAVSRQSKMLMGIALLALGAYLWFNYLSQSSASFLPPFLGGNQTVNSINTNSGSATVTPTIDGSTPVVANQSDLVVAPLANGNNEVQVVSPNIDMSATTAAREVIIVDLPFLITEPPSEDASDSDVVADGVAQNQYLRATVNPFSPIVIEESRDNRRQVNSNQNSSSSEIIVSGQAKPGSATVVGQPTRAAFKAPTELIKSTPLRTVTPAPSLANNLPRTLSNGTLSATPGILRNQNVVPPLASEVAAAKKAAEEAEAMAEKARQEAEQAAAIAAAEAAANAPETPAITQEAVAAAQLPVLRNPKLRTPHSASPSLAIVSGPTQISAPASVPGLLQSGRDASQIEISSVQSEAATQANQNAETGGTVKIDFENADVIEDPKITGGPIEAGVSELTRYLRDYNFEYTGSVIGAVRSVGMFRTNVSATPITITLGQTIPKTDIVLTNLQNNQAEFTQGQDKVILNLDLRR